MFVGATGAGQQASRLTPDEEEEAITEMALLDHAKHRGGAPEDVYRPRMDPASAENMRNQALQEFFQRKAELDRRFQEQLAAQRRPEDQEEAGERGEQQ